MCPLCAPLVGTCRGTVRCFEQKAKLEQIKHFQAECGDVSLTLFH